MGVVYTGASPSEENRSAVGGHVSRRFAYLLWGSQNVKRRYYGHTASCRDKKHSTEMELNPEPDIVWSILPHTSAYSKGNRNCGLCLTEKLHIAKKLSGPNVYQQKIRD